MTASVGWSLSFTGCALLVGAWQAGSIGSQHAGTLILSGVLTLMAGYHHLVYLLDRHLMKINFFWGAVTGCGVFLLWEIFGKTGQTSNIGILWVGVGYTIIGGCWYFLALLEEKDAAGDSVMNWKLAGMIPAAMTGGMIPFLLAYLVGVP